MIFTYYKGQAPVADVNSYSTSPLAASGTAAQTATPNDPNDSFCMPANFWTSTSFNGELREEWAIHGGTWPNNTNRIAIFHGGRNTSGTMGTNYLTTSELTASRTTLGYSGRGSTNLDWITKSRHGYLSNNVAKPTNGSGAGTNSVLGLAVDPSNLNSGSAALTDGTNTYTNNPPAAGSSWMGRGSGYSNLGTSLNGAGPDGSRWGFVWLR